MFNFKPKSDEELLKLLEKGEGQFEVLEASYHTKNGNTTLKLILRIWDKDGNTKTIWDFLSPKAEWKIKNFCYSCGLEAQYENGGIEPEFCVGKSGRLKIGIKQDDGYPPNNCVDTYIRTKQGDEPVKSKYVPESEQPNDDIPF